MVGYSITTSIQWVLWVRERDLLSIYCFATCNSYMTYTVINCSLNIKEILYSSGNQFINAMYKSEKQPEVDIRYKVVRNNLRFLVLTIELSMVLGKSISCLLLEKISYVIFFVILNHIFLNKKNCLHSCISFYLQMSSRV